ncbi:TRAP transporter small permease [Dethiosulfatarculus sandiegensis]|uniref:Tripartite ATP-independent periplasmic transporters DctQ component domain-containing protein n=1 Tax=Dethiosulfatarculus sandiegensis TaxID=1429043 RepID=A0A0D2HV89_9BACT|nr:TRAP transporter small permease subunit [Dethiosulfatarculus sandiegensis]KIX14333.1 hypothetical protein X474_08715 [Dethiosulfatarculus sandiegensis]
MSALNAVLDRMERWGILICFTVSLAALCISVVTRYLFQRPLTWPDELTTCLFMFMTFLGAVMAVPKKAELKVDVLYEFFPKARFGLDLLLHLVRLGVGLTLIYAGVNFMLIEMEMETVTPILKIPNSLLSGMLPFFGLLLALRSIGEVHKLWAKPRQEDR